jgi:hypothetical protein
MASSGFVIFCLFSFPVFGSLIGSLAEWSKGSKRPSTSSPAELHEKHGAALADQRLNDSTSQPPSSMKRA